MTEEREILTREVVNRLINIDLVLIQSEIDGTVTLRVHPNFREA